MSNNLKPTRKKKKRVNKRVSDVVLFVFGLLLVRARQFAIGALANTSVHSKRTPHLQAVEEDGCILSAYLVQRYICLT